MSIEELNRIGGELKRSPLFNLSLASKELFHSNFLSWLSECNWDVFVKVMSDLAKKHFDWNKKDFEVCREDDNFDLSVRKKLDNMPVFVLENKVKSIPTEEQLKRYTEKVQSKKMDITAISFVLLSLTELNNCPTEWKQRNYNDLSNYILRYLNDIADCYHRLVVMDYCTYISNLQLLADNWNMSLLPTEDYPKLLNDLRLNDVYQKATCSFLCKELEKKLRDKDISPVHIDKFDLKDQYKSQEVFTRYDMSHGEGLFEVIIKVGDIWYEIMIQGSNYQHMIYGEEDVIKTLLNVKKEKLRFVFDGKQYPDILQSDLQGDGNKKKGYNSYSKDGYLTIYKYKKIDDVNDNDAILNAIVNEVRSF